MPSQRLGDINGWWGMLFKLQLALVPFGVGWAVWVTSSIYSLQPTMPRYSYADAAREHSAMWREIDARFDSLPPADWRDRIQRVETQQREMTVNQIKILTSLERLQKNSP